MQSRRTVPSTPPNGPGTLLWPAVAGNLTALPTSMLGLPCFIPSICHHRLQPAGDPKPEVVFMSRRSRAREVALQILFEDDVNPRTTADELTSFLKARLKSPEMEKFCLSLILGVRRNQEELDSQLNEISNNWTVKRMASTDRNVLRLGAYEVLHTDVPYKVAINEAVDLAKRFGNANSSQFVNGILDRLKRDNQKQATGG